MLRSIEAKEHKRMRIFVLERPSKEPRLKMHLNTLTQCFNCSTKSSRNGLNTFQSFQFKTSKAFLLVVVGTIPSQQPNNWLGVEWSMFSLCLHGLNGLSFIQSFSTLLQYSKCWTEHASVTHSHTFIEALVSTPKCFLANTHITESNLGYTIVPKDTLALDWSIKPLTFRLVDDLFYPPELFM